MKRLLFSALCCLLIIIGAALPSAAQELSEEMVRVVSDNLDNFFPLSSISEGFATKSQPVRGNIGPETATEVSTNGTRNILLYANPNGATEYVLEEKVNAGNLKNFYYELDVIPNDIYPNGGGGCYIGYVNEFIPGVSTEEPVSATMLVISDAVYLESRGTESEPGSREKLADFINKDNMISEEKQKSSNLEKEINDLKENNNKNDGENKWMSNLSISEKNVLTIEGSTNNSEKNDDNKNMNDVLIDGFLNTLDIGFNGTEEEDPEKLDANIISHSECEPTPSYLICLKRKNNGN